MRSEYILLESFKNAVDYNEYKGNLFHLSNLRNKHAPCQNCDRPDHQMTTYYYGCSNIACVEEATTSCPKKYKVNWCS